MSAQDAARRIRKKGPLSGAPPDTPWTWCTGEIMRSPTWQALNISARRIHDFLMHELVTHAGRENGTLGATYRQLEAWGVTKDDIHKGFLELEICGFVQKTAQGMRVAGGGEFSRYALTHFPTMVGTPDAKAASDEWREVIIRNNRAGRVTVRQVREWLRQEVLNRSAAQPRAAKRAATQKRKLSTASLPASTALFVGKTVDPTRDIEGAPTMRGGPQSQVRGENMGEILELAPHVRGSAPRR